MYQVFKEFYNDAGLRFEVGQSDLAGLTPDEIANVQANGWVGAEGELPVEPAEKPAEPEPLALPHWEGKGKAPKGYWEYEYAQAERRKARQAKAEVETDDTDTTEDAADAAKNEE